MDQDLRERVETLEDAVRMLHARLATAEEALRKAHRVMHTLTRLTKVLHERLTLMREAIYGRGTSPPGPVN